MVCETSLYTEQFISLFLNSRELQYYLTPQQTLQPAPLESLFSQTLRAEGEWSVCTPCHPNVQVKNMYTFYT